MLPFFTPQIPRAFAMYPKIIQMLNHTVYAFNHEEQQAIYYYYCIKLTPQEIAPVVEMTEDHVISTLALYAERLNVTLNLIKKAKPYDASEMMQVNEILLLWSA